MREASNSGDSIAITLRQLESLIRLAEARARAALRDKVLVEDAEAAVKLMDRCLQDVGIDTATSKYDIDMIMTGKPKSLRDKLQVMLGIILEMQKDAGMVERAAVIAEAERRGFTRTDAERVIEQLFRENSLYEPREGYIKKT